MTLPGGLSRGGVLFLNTCENPFVPYILGEGDFGGDFFCSWKKSIWAHFFLLGTAGSSLLTGVCFEVTWQRGFLPMFTHYTFKYDTLTPIHSRTLMLLSNSLARNRKFIPRVKAALFANAKGLVLNSHIWELLIFKYWICLIFKFLRDLRGLLGSLYLK